jgi:NAD(P)-dependent dehydrogenase (short-subunit alcohol dehydrogenase family)
MRNGGHVKCSREFPFTAKDLSPRGYEAIRSTVMDGSFYMTLAVGKRWIADGVPGAVVSNLVTWIWSGSAFVTPSAMAKTAIHAMTMSLAVEWGGYGIRLNATAPGAFPTNGRVSDNLCKRCRGSHSREEGIPQ